MSIKSHRTSQAQTPWAVQYNSTNRQDGASDTQSVFSDVKSRRSFAQSIRSRAVEPLPVKDLPVEDKMSRVAASIKEQEGPLNDNGNTPAVNPAPENNPHDQEADDDRAELYDEINSLYNMENPKGDDPDERKSQFSS